MGDVAWLAGTREARFGSTVEATAFTSTEGGLLSAGGINKFAKWVVELSVDDFDISTDFNVEQITERRYHLTCGQAKTSAALGSMERVIRCRRFMGRRC